MRLRANGYRTAFGGKEHCQVLNYTGGKKQDFDRWFGFANGSGDGNYWMDSNPTNPAENGVEPEYGLTGDQIEYVYLRRNNTNLNYCQGEGLSQKHQGGQWDRILRSGHGCMVFHPQIRP